MLTIITIPNNNMSRLTSESYINVQYLDKKNGTIDIVLCNDYNYKVNTIVFNYDISDNHITISYNTIYNDFNECMKNCKQNREHIYERRREEITYLDKEILNLKKELNIEFENNITNNISLSDREYKIRTELHLLCSMKKKHIDEINLLSKTPICFKYTETKKVIENRFKYDEWSNRMHINTDSEHNYDIIFNYTNKLPNERVRIKEIKKRLEINFTEPIQGQLDNEFDELIL